MAIYLTIPLGADERLICRFFHHQIFWTMFFQVSQWYDTTGSIFAAAKVEDFYNI